MIANDGTIAFKGFLIEPALCYLPYTEIRLRELNPRTTYSVSNSKTQNQ